MIKLSRFFGFVSIACALVLLAGNLAAQMPSGTLEVRGSVQITEGASGESMTVRDTNYSWFSGDRIQVRNGYGILYLNEGNSLGLLEGTDATLTIDNDTISGTLESGDLIYAIEGEDRELVVKSGEFEFNAMPAGDLAPCLGLTAAGLIQAIASTRNRVVVQSGELLGYNQPRTVERRVAPGEKYEFTPQAARRLELDLPPEVEEKIDTDRSALPCMVWWMQEEVAGAAIAGLTAGSRIGLGIAGISGATIGYQIIDDDDDQDPDPVSP
ncbi:hypothetical protein [Wenzhouxiangella sp. EGI_FJ10305]|uniref:hypothetical protein n=1 Tax=Wenzhouxiangella sp. EGI_FJ10305 TaxID=3243768 RepID=UPI0035DD3290